MTQLMNRTAVITGAARGLGRKMAWHLAHRGARVVAWDVDEDGLHTLLPDLPGWGHSVDVVDVKDRTAVQDTAQAVLRRQGGVDVVINNAGVVNGQRLLDVPEEKIRATMDTNALALFWTTKAFLPSMIQRSEGHIVTVASAAGLVAASRLTDYSASKFAAVGFDEALRMELRRIAPFIKTTVVCPYYVDTGMFDGATTRFKWLLPILREEDVARETVEAVEQNKRRLLLPRSMNLLPPLRLLPVNVFDRFMGFLGVNASMDQFRGRQLGAATP